MEKSCWKLLFWQIFFKNFGCVFQGQTLFWPYLRNGWSDWCETKWKCIGWILGIIYDLDLWPHDLDLGCFKVKFWNSCISGIVGLVNVKWKGNELIGYWADYMTLPFDHTHDLDLGVSRSESEIALSQEWDGRLTWNKKDVNHPFMTMVLTGVTVVVWADVLDSDRGDFRRWRGVDISSLLSMKNSVLSSGMPLLGLLPWCPIF